MTKIYLARHGSTAWNESPRFRGLADLALSETGVGQAQALRDLLAERRFSAVYTSSLRRAVQTAQIIAEPKTLPLRQCEGLRSVDYGRWEGMTEEEAKESDPGLYSDYIERIESVRFPGGETLDELRERAMAVISEICREYPSQEVVVVSHQVVTRVLLCSFLGVSSAPYWRIGQDAGCLNVISHNRGRFQILSMNVVPSRLFA